LPGEQDSLLDKNGVAGGKRRDGTYRPEAGVFEPLQATILTGQPEGESTWRGWSQGHYERLSRRYHIAIGKSPLLRSLFALRRVGCLIAISAATVLIISIIGILIAIFCN